MVKLHINGVLRKVLLQLYKYLLAYLMYLHDLGPQTPRRLKYHQPVKHLSLLNRTNLLVFLMHDVSPALC